MPSFFVSLDLIEQRALGRLAKLLPALFSPSFSDLKTERQEDGSR